MKRGLLGALILVLCMVMAAWGANLYTAGNASDNIVMPSGGGYPTVYAINFTGGAATADLIVYEGDNTEVVSSAGKAATATTFVVDTCVGIDDDDVVVIQQRATGSPIEAATVSSCVETTGVITLAAGTGNAYNGTLKFDFFEMKVLTTWADIGTDRLNLEGKLFQGGTRDKPLVVNIDGSGGTFHYMTGGWE